MSPKNRVSLVRKLLFLALAASDFGCGGSSTTPVEAKASNHSALVVENRDEIHAHRKDLGPGSSRHFDDFTEITPYLNLFLMTF